MIKLSPGSIIVFSLLLVIIAGATLLSLPISSTAGTPTNFLDEYFTSNSALCVTGLVTLDIGTHFSLFGLIIIMLLIQIGGLVSMTFSTFLIMIFRQKMFISQKLAVQEALSLYSTKDIVNIMWKILIIVFSFEGLGAAILFLRWLPEMGFGNALLYSIFHSISAFNNAGLALPANFANLSAYLTDTTINLTITTLVIFGGIGIFVLSDLLQRRRLSLHSRVAILSTLFLIVGGTLMILALEYNNPQTIGNMLLPHKLLVSYFNAVTARTAGFHTLNTMSFIPATALLTMFLMFIGASPGGTGGGIKTTTFALMVSTIRATLKGYRDTIIFNRRIPPETVRRAFTISFLAISIIAAAIFTLDKFEASRFSLLAISFEVFSAFSNVGLSFGITPLLSSIGKIIIIMVMFIGRIGPLTLLLALSLRQKETRVEPPKEGISIG